MSEQNQLSDQTRAEALLQFARKPLQEGDVYTENGRWVFTEQYHRRRGFCCDSGCRHCPYRNADT